MRSVLNFIQPYDAGLFPEDFPEGNVISLASNENSYGPSEAVKKAYFEAANKIWQYPKASYSRLKKALAEYTGFEEKNIAVGNGASELILNVCNALIEELDRVVIPMPTYTLYAIYAMLRNASISFPVFDGYRIEADLIAEEKPKLVFLCSPNNPTGNTVDRKTVERIAENAEYVVLDEAYVEFSEDSKVDLVEEFDNLIVIRSFSKFFALAGLRVGYAICSSEIAEAIEKIRLPFSISLPAVEAAIAALNSLEYYLEVRKKIIEERERLIQELKKIDWLQVYPSEANFVLVKSEREDLVEELLKNGIIVRNASVLGLLGLHVRITVGRPEENEKLIGILKGI